MVGGGPGAFIGAVHRTAARLDGRWTLAAGAFSADASASMRHGRELGLEPDRCYADYRAMVAAERSRADRVDAVAIVTPNHLHADIATAFIEAGIAVICEKPMVASVMQAERLTALVARTGVPFVLTHNYSGYPMVRQARALVEAGALGSIRVVQVEYAQDWLALTVERRGDRQAAWRTDPARAGPGGALGDIGTHAYHLAGFVTGLVATDLLAVLCRFGEGRRLDDNAQVLLRYQGGASGALWASQVAVGRANALRLRVYGDRGGVEWDQERPDDLWFAPVGDAPRRLRRGSAALSPAAAQATRLPPGHPEGYLEGFAQIYLDAAALIAAWRDGHEPAIATALLPTVTDGLAGARFVEAAVASDAAGGRWTELEAE